MEQKINCSIPPQEKISVDENIEATSSFGMADHGFCAICLEKILLEETALVKGCEHAYCVTCILRWASYNTHPCCPQCKHPFLFLGIHRSLDGCIHDCMFEESVCLLLRAKWFKPLILEVDEVAVEEEDFYQYGHSDDDDDMDEAFYGGFSGLRIGNRRWGDNGYVRAGRKEARPIDRAYQGQDDEGSSSSRGSGRNKEVVTKDGGGRRAKRASKREAADKAAAVAAKHQQHLLRLGRK